MTLSVCIKVSFLLTFEGKFVKICALKWPVLSGEKAEDIPAVSMPITLPLKAHNICGSALCDKIAHFVVSFIVSIATCAVIMLFSQRFDIQHLAGGRVTLAKQRCQLTWICFTNLSTKYKKYQKSFLLIIRTE